MQVCEEAQCPNIGECWNGGTGTIMLLGDTVRIYANLRNIITKNSRETWHSHVCVVTQEW